MPVLYSQGGDYIELRWVTGLGKDGGGTRLVITDDGITTLSGNDQTKKT